MRIFLAFPLLITLVGCTEDVHVSGFRYGISTLEDLSCMDAESPAYEIYGEYYPEEKRREIEEQLDAARKKCEVAQALVANLSQSVEKLSSGYLMPTRKHLFDVQFDREFEIPVGLFESEAVCAEAAAQLRRAGHSVSSCYSRAVFWRSIWS